VDDETSTKLVLSQPTRRRKWELRRGEETVAELTLPSVKRGGKARADGRELEIRTSGVIRRVDLLVDAATGEELARVRGRKVEFSGVESAEWKSLGRKAGYGLVGRDGEAWLRAKAKSGLVRTTGVVEVAAGHEVAIPALLAAFLLIRHADEVAAAAAATTVAAT
jgi:hypothetical protein